MFDAFPGQATSGALQQNPNFARALRALGRSALMTDGPEARLVMCRRLRGGVKLAMLSRVILRTPETLIEQMRQIGVTRHLLILSPEHPAPDLAQIGAIPVMTPATVAEIDLTRDHDSRRAGLHQKWRNRLVHSESRALRVTRQNMPTALNHWLFRAEAAQQDRRGYRNWPAALTLAYARENPGQAKLFTAFEGRDPVAAMLFLRHDGGATYHIGHTTVRGRALSAHNLVFWQATCWLADKGHRRLDLGLIDTCNAPDLARFKLGTGARPRSLGGTWAWWPPLGRMLAPLARLDHDIMH